jgi:fatty acid desaturase
MTNKPSEPTDYRRYRRETDRRLLLAVIGVLVVGGGALIGLVYGGWAAATGLICLLAGAAVILFLWLLLTLVERWVSDSE